MKLVSADIENFRSIKKCSIHFNEITAKKYLSKQMAKKYYQYFTIDFVEKFLEK